MYCFLPLSLGKCVCRLPIGCGILPVGHLQFWCTGEQTAGYLVQKQDFQVWMQLSCQAIQNGGPNSGCLGIRASDLAFPNITLPHGTEYTYVYIISCQGTVTTDATGSRVLLDYQLAQSPEVSCAEMHALIAQQNDYLIRYGGLHRANAEQRAQMQPNSGGVVNAAPAAAAATATTHPHAQGLQSGPSLHPIRAVHGARAPKWHVLGVERYGEAFLQAARSRSL